MKTSRKDIERNKKQVILPNVSFIGYSTNKLRYGDYFVYKEHYTNGTFGRRLAKCHGQVKPIGKIDETDVIRWYILAQAADDMMHITFERWIKPEDVIEMRPAENMHELIKAWFEEQEDTCL